MILRVPRTYNLSLKSVATGDQEQAEAVRLRMAVFSVTTRAARFDGRKKLAK